MIFRINCYLNLKYLNSDLVIDLYLNMVVVDLYCYLLVFKLIPLFLDRISSHVLGFVDEVISYWPFVYAKFINKNQAEN